MKTIYSLILLVLIASCSAKKLDKPSNDWKELESFHTKMADAFHPYKDSANLAPSKKIAKDMADEAAKWLSAQLPEQVDNDEMKTKLQNLNAGSQDFLKLVNESAPDSILAKSLVELHNRFHSVQEGWYGAAKEGEGHEDH